MLSPEDLEEVEASCLPVLERHDLRLLAHGLRTFQAIAATTEAPQRMPDLAQMERWAANQPAMADDPAFRAAFLDQLSRLVDPLERIAAAFQRSPLTLQIPQLVAWAKERADARLSPPGPPPG
ncbi:MAG: hypothetical protein ACK41W_10580 [Cyanobacteriota bacterium]